MCVAVLLGAVFPGNPVDVLFAQHFGGRRALTGEDAHRPAPAIRVRAGEFDTTLTSSSVETAFPPTPSVPVSGNGRASRRPDASDPHPAVARIIGFEDHSVNTSGSGTYLGEWENYGLVLTNEHVVADTKGLVQVHFPNRNVYYAAVVSRDSDWDLALLLLSKAKNIPSVSVAKTPPRVGDPLWIAGYGRGRYRLAGGRCLMYVVLSDKEEKKNLPAEFLDVSIYARDGDSGGPIFNEKGELAGVLCASNNETTVGSYSGRVRKFLDRSYANMVRVPKDPLALFARVEPRTPRHSLAEGIRIFESQKETAKNDPVVASASPDRSPEIVTHQTPFISGGKRGSGSNLASRLLDTPQMKNAATIDGRRIARNTISFYPKFPAFDLPAAQLFTEERFRLARKTALERSGFAKTEADASKKESSKKESPEKESVAPLASVPVPVSETKTTPIVPKAKTPWEYAAEISAARPLPHTAIADFPHRIREQATGSTRTQTQKPSSEQVQREKTLPQKSPVVANPPESVPVLSVPNTTYATSYSAREDTEIIPDAEHALSEADRQTRSGSVLETVKILAVVAIGFFVLFNLVKLMTIIEENRVETD